jgi:carboxylesterase type B
MRAAVVALLLLAMPLPPGCRAGVVTVETAHGQLACATVGERTRQCLGVPFAAPPVADLRWRAPANVSAWSGARDATRTQPICIQGGRAPVPNQTDEDCLYLNVFSPRQAPPRGGGFPVVVWLHGGAYATGSPQNASMLVDLSQELGEPIVWVGVNYRLNVFGFLGGQQLAARDPEGSFGNYGLQDQRKALAFVREHIGQFGGDPTRITIDGCSAGAGSVANHLTNRKSWPYFDRASGNSGVLAAWNTNPRNQSQRMYDLTAGASGCAKRGGGGGGANAHSIACMVAQTAAQVVAAASKAFAADPDAHWGPTVDGVDVVASPHDQALRGELHTGVSAPWPSLVRPVFV